MTRVFLKLGGSLITDKDSPYTARKNTIARIVAEISTVIKSNPNLEILLGHGSGSFGHFAAKDLGTRDQVTNTGEWLGFQKVWQAANSLNRIIVDECIRADLPVISLPPSAAILTENRKIKKWNYRPIQSALENGLIPIIFGDVVFDDQLGGIILSTEDLFLGLLPKIKPDLILLSGKEPGVWKDYPNRTEIIPAITSSKSGSSGSNILSSASIDVTGGMASKVTLMMEAIKLNPEMQIRIFSGERQGNIINALSGLEVGTAIKF